MDYIIKNINEYDNSYFYYIYKNVDKKKKRKIDKYRNNNAKRRSLIGEEILKLLLLKHNVNYDYRDLQINKNGKPYLTNNPVFFSISHSHDYVIAVISKNEIGVDVEKIRKTPIKVINKFATELEKKYIFSSNSDIEKRIFEIFTLKEAYFKMKGENLNNIFQIEFIIKNNKVICSDKSVRSGFIRNVNNYIIAFCEKKDKNSSNQS